MGLKPIPIPLNDSFMRQHWIFRIAIDTMLFGVIKGEQMIG